jgi:cytochrome P450
VRGHLILGHLRSFRHDRVGMQLRIGRSHPDVAALRFGLVKVVIVGSPALAHELLSAKNESFVKAPGLSLFLRPVLGDGLLTSEGARHASQRKLLAPAFAQKRIAAYASTMAERAERWASTLREGAPLDAADGMMRITLDIVAKTLFDAEVGAEAEAVNEAVTTAMETVMAQMSSVVPIPPSVPTPRNLEGRRAVARLDAIVYRIIRARRGQGDRGDVLSILLAAADERGGGMTDRQVRDEVMTLFLAGHETTANALAWTLYLLARNPRERRMLESEIDALGRAPTYDDLARLPYTLAAFKEAMRLYPPAYSIGRRATAEVRIGDHVLPRGTIVLVNIMGIHRRPDVWPRPEDYRPERFLEGRDKALPRCAYMPFGDGPRICIGNHFALMEAHVVLATILRGRRFELASDAPVETEPLVTLRPKGGLPMRMLRR